ncbi:GNAT family N-acetyltransferase [Flavivirga algicola]|uniref:GNAT family N-acetyltransferase n=1 Tax=Flavivirga algicola TaxID=2729136 RepID=A0ABX1S0F5_9FLAO|nr:GNAT family N-acetyltransferase [Flavivirga algicola]NMH88224.1 GNAT family N-acetyltransferase [Flavivirga algicola]
MLSKLFSSQSNHLIFDLFIETKISIFFSNYAINSLSQKSLKVKKDIADFNFKKIKMIKDVPNYIQFKLNELSPDIVHKVIPQYSGYLINTVGYKDASDYITKNLSKRNKKNLNSKKNKLYKNHKIFSEFHHGFIEKNEYDTIFKTFYKLLKNRFNEKKMHNRYLSTWKELQSTTYQKILDKKASLHVVYNDITPIAITLNYHLNDIVFSHIQTFDTNYSKYNMGDISMLIHLEWLIKNNINVFDLSMGKTYYKEKWCNHKYTFMYHLFYSKKSILSRICSRIIVQELKLIQFLRDKNIIGTLINFDKLLFNYK